MPIERKDRPIFSGQSVRDASGNSSEKPVTVIINNNPSGNNLNRRQFLRLAALTIVSGGAGAAAGITIKDKLTPKTEKDARVPILENSLQAAKDTIKNLQEQVENLEKQGNQNQQQIASITAENRQLTQENKEAKAQVSQAESEAQRERNKALEATVRTTKLEEEKEQLSQENSKLSLENKTLRETFDLVTFKYQEIIRKIFAKSPVDEVLLPVLGIMEISASLFKNINSKAKETHDDIEKTFIVLNFLRQTEKISDLTFAAFGSLYDSVVYPVSKKLREMADWLEEKNPLSQKALEIIEKSNWEPLRALLNVRNKFLAFYQFFLEKMPNQIEERRQLRNQKIDQIEKELESNPPAIIEFLDKTINFFERTSKVWENREGQIKLLREWVQDLREAEQKSKELTESYKGGSGGNPTLY